MRHLTTAISLTAAAAIVCSIGYSIGYNNGWESRAPTIEGNFKQIHELLDERRISKDALQASRDLIKAQEEHTAEQKRLLELYHEIYGAAIPEQPED